MNPIPKTDIPKEPDAHVDYQLDLFNETFLPGETVQYTMPDGKIIQPILTGPAFYDAPLDRVEVPTTWAGATNLPVRYIAKVGSTPITRLTP